MRKLLYSIAFLGLSTAALAQNLNSHYLYQMNGYNINPARAFQSDGMHAILNPGTQMVGIQGNPTNAMVGVYGAVNDRVGLGAKVIADRRGYFSNTTMEVSYAYLLKIKENHSLAVGVSAGMYSSALNSSGVVNDRYTNGTDPSIFNQDYNEKQFLSGVGLRYTAGKLDLGLSSPHLIISGKEISDHFFLTAKYSFNFTVSRIELRPVMVYQHLSKSPSILDISVQTEYNKLIWIQTGFRSNNSGLVGIGISLENVRFGYMYGLGFGKLNTLNSGSHEIMISTTLFRRNPVAVGLQSGKM